jgi:hypothetical protein
VYTSIPSPPPSSIRPLPLSCCPLHRVWIGTISHPVRSVKQDRRSLKLTCKSLLASETKGGPAPCVRRDYGSGGGTLSWIRMTEASGAGVLSPQRRDVSTGTTSWAVPAVGDDHSSGCSYGRCRPRLTGGDRHRPQTDVVCVWSEAPCG